MKDNFKDHQQKFFDDLAGMAGGAVNVISGMRQQISDDIKSKVDDMAAKMDLVPREDLDHALAMIDKLRKEQTALSKRIDALEGKTKAKPATKPKATKTAKTKSKTPKAK